MKKILLFGSPNVGKSVLFSRLTGAKVVISNYPGTTVEFTRGKMRVGEKRVDVEDAPGTYSLEPSNRAEEVAVKMLDELGKDGVVVLVLDSTNLERGLFLLLQVLKRRLPTVVALNMWDEAKHIGIDVDAERLQNSLGIPCVPTVAITGVGVKELVESLSKATVSTIEFEDAEIWHRVGDIVREIQTVRHRHHTILERLGDASVKPLTGIPLAVAVMLLSFFAIRFIGEGLIGYLEPLFEKYWAAVALLVSDGLGGEGTIHDIVVGELAVEEIGTVSERDGKEWVLIEEDVGEVVTRDGRRIVVVEEEEGRVERLFKEMVKEIEKDETAEWSVEEGRLIIRRELTLKDAEKEAVEESAARLTVEEGRLLAKRVDYGESFGLLTTGLFVPFAAVLPYVFAFFLILSFLEDLGYLPRLAVLVDTLMHRLGLHGIAIVPMMLGLGCNVPGALSARILESRKERFIAMTLMAIAVPCMAQIAMVFGLAGKFGPSALLPIFGTLFVVWLLIGALMRRFVRGESPEILLDVPPYRLPYWKALLKKVWMRIVWFVRGAVPWVLVGILIVNILYTLGIIEFLGNILRPVIIGLLGLPKDAVGALIIGFLRKDVAVGMLEPLHLNLAQTIVACVVLTLYIPCAAAFAVLLKELGWKDMLKSVLIMVLTAVSVGTLLNLILRKML